MEKVIDRLIEAVGLSTTESIIRAIGGERVPNRLNYTGRDEIIKEEFQEMLEGGSSCMSSYSQLADRWELSPRRIMAIVNK
jgi:hypothetical protein